MINNEDNREQ